MNQKILNTIATDKKTKMLDQILKTIKEAGGEAYRVGGSIRDFVLNQTSEEQYQSKDIDIEVYGLSIDKLFAVLSLFNPKLVGKIFGVIKVDNYDFSLPRRDVKISKGHKGFEVVFDPMMDKKEACRRRDFTMNSMMQNAYTGEYFDFFGGADDIDLRIIRATDPKHFGEDPLRVLRAVQFAVRFGMEVEPHTSIICSLISLEDLPVERIWEEIVKIMVKGKYFLSHFENALMATYTEDIFHDLCVLRYIEQNPKHHPEGNVWEHTMRALDYAAEHFTFTDDKHKLKVMLAIMLHDIGKAETTELQEDGRITSVGHDKVGAELTENFLCQYTTDVELIEDVVSLVANHMVPLHFYNHKEKISRASLNRLSTRVSSIEDLLMVAEADACGTLKPDRKLIKKFLQEDLKTQIIAANILNSQPKRLIEYKDLDVVINPPTLRGFTINYLYEQQLQGKFNTTEEGIEFFSQNFQTIMEEFRVRQS